MWARYVLPVTAASITGRRAMSRLVAAAGRSERTDAGPSSPRQLASASLEQDRRGYPDRTYTTEILHASPRSIRWKQKGKEPVHDIDVDMHTDDDDGRECHLALQHASHALRQGHLVAFPTETVYGLAGNALDADAAGKIFSTKGRPADNPLIVHISDMSMLERLVPSSYSLSDAYAALAQAFWPGPLTILVPVDEEKVPSVVRCGLGSLGVRMPSHPIARALIATARLPLAAPSANVSGRPSPTTAQHVFHDMTTMQGGQIVGRIPYVLDGGASDVGLESTVVDAITNPDEVRVLRPGGVSVEAIERVLRQHGLQHTVRVYGKDMAKDANAEMNPTTPGMKYRHYSPEAQVVVLITGGKGSSKRDAMVSQTLGHSVAQTLLTRGAQDVVAEQVQQYIGDSATGGGDGGGQVRVGLMSMDDSALTATLLGIETRRDCGAYTLQCFSLGSTAKPEQAAHRLFDGLRTLDEGDAATDGQRNGCDLIFVEAVDDDSGIGLAIMNRLNKAASRTILVDV